MRFTGLILLAAFLYSHLVCAQTADFKKFLAKRIVVLDRPLMTFHYRTRTEDPSSEKEATELVQRSTVGFYNRDIISDGNTAGPGLYTAIDPVASREYGGKAPQMYVITLAKGTRIFDTGQPFEGDDKEAFINLLKKYDCYNPQINYHALLTTLRFNPNATCRLAVIQALGDLKVQAILYYYRGAKLESCDEARNGAFNIISPDAILDKGVSFYSNKSTIGANPKLSAFLSALSKESLADSSFDYISKDAGLEMPTTLQKDQEINPQEYSTFKGDLIMGCGPQRQLKNPVSPFGF